MPEAENKFKLISIIMPVYNGESYIDKSIKTVTSTLEYYNIPHEIIVVDDGSRDNTLHKARRAASKHSNVRVIGYQGNLGRGAAFINGCKHDRKTSVL